MKRVRQSKSVEHHSSPNGSVLFWRNGKRRLGRLEGGAVLPLVVASMFALAFMAGLAIDAGRAYTSRDEVQGAADAAALAGSQALVQALREGQKFTDVRADIVDVAEQVAEAHGYSLESPDEVEVSIESSDSKNEEKEDNYLVNVIITRQHATFIDYGGIKSLSPRGVAKAGVGPSPPIARCLTILSTDDNSLSIGNAADMVNPGSNCGIQTMGGITAGNNSEVSDFRAITACGPFSGGGEVTGETQERYELKENYKDDSYCTPPKGMEIPPSKSCGALPNGKSTRLTVDDQKKPVTIYPGVYCGGIEVKKGTLLLKPGVYVIKGGGLSVEDTIACESPCNDGVVIVNDGDNGSYPYGSIEILSNVTVNLPPIKSTDAYNGFLFVQPEANKKPMMIASNNKLPSGSEVRPFNLFLPGATLSIAANTDVRASSITAWKLVLAPNNRTKLTLDSGLLKTNEKMTYPTPVLHE